ncbi:MAG: class I SAM-dependent methyltransferase [Polaromonas sp.]
MQRLLNHDLAMHNESDSSKIDNLYNSQYVTWKGWKNLFNPLPFEIRYFEGEFLNMPLNSKRILEIGFGAGTFISWASQVGANVSGCELIEELCLAGAAKGFDTRFGDISIFNANSERFDLIVAFDVMEHIEANKLVEFMICVRKLLKPDGMFMARTPNGGSPWGLMYQNSDISHVTILSPGRFQQLADASGMQLVDCRNAYRVLKSNSQFTDRIRFLIRDLMEWITSSVYGLWKVPLDPNIVAQFRLKL